MAYDPKKAWEYAHKWALSRNPKYYDFEKLGGNCTNFVSQCIYAGCGSMNYTKNTGWYYNSLNDRAPAWTGVEYFYKFMTRNKGKGPHATEIDLADVKPGDIIQLSFQGFAFTHTAFVLAIDETEVWLAQNSDDYLFRALSTHDYKKIRVLRITDCKM